MSTQQAITAKITRKPTPTATRFRNAIGKYKVIRTDRCIGCGKCAQLCPHGVHVRYVAYSRTARPKDHLCRGTWCKENCDYYCIDKCPVGALSMGPNPVYESMGDPRWTPDMIISTWDQAENGRITNDTLEPYLGASGGGFDKLRLSFPRQPAAKLKPSQVERIRSGVQRGSPIDS